MAIGITLTVLPEEQEAAARVVEALSRVATGFAFEGLSVTISINTYEPDSTDI